ncbi:MAG: phytoene/squalene synthase family protein [Chitinophagaceae bacterium]|nr:phytoene/squalene synthase family protein [Oligoflexus sp.]
MNTQTYSYDSIQKGSLSFSFAASIFGKRIRDRVVRLYAWCRYVDDQIDDEGQPLEKKMVVLKNLAKQSFDTLVSVDIAPAIKAFRELRDEIKLPIEQPIDLLKGMSMDLCQQRYHTLQDLELYCYRVAGVVGLMMTHVMGINDRRAYQHAVDLGLAMQLTNICRDIVTDAKLGRIYLPETWLQDAGLDPLPEVLLDPNNRAALIPIVDLLLGRAEELYSSGDQGLKYLPIRCAIAVAIAREVYAAIGHEVLRLGPKAWDARTWIPFPKKLLLGFRGLLKVLKTSPCRFRNRQLRRSRGSETTLA